MGGNAFKNALPDARFPRMAPSIYNSLKARLLLQLQTLYEHVAVPREAPGKADYGDIDFVVYQPRAELHHEDVRSALGAAQSISFDSSHSNFALRAIEYDNSAETSDYYQVDVEVCATMEEWERVVLFNSYGDVGMILGLMVRPHGLSFGRNGIKLAKPLPTSPPLTLHLSQSFPLIMEFFGLSMDRWQRGFSTQEEIFLWLSSSRLFDPTTMLRSEEGLSRARTRANVIRPMYQKFLYFTRSRAANTQRGHLGDVFGDALEFFGRRPLYTVLLRIAEIKKHVATNFTGTAIKNWTGLNGVPIRFTMEEVKRQLGGDEVLTTVSGIHLDSLPAVDINSVHLTLSVWECTMSGMSAEAIQQMVVRVKEELQSAGKLEYDWRAAKQRKEEKRRNEEAPQLSDISYGTV